MIIRRWVMDEWSDSFVREARLQLIPGSRIGDVLAEVDAHCADSGQSRHEAFGDPVSYARALARGGHRAARSRPRYLLWSSGVKALFTFGGILCLLDGTDAVAHGTRGSLTVGQLASVGGGAITMIFIVVALIRPGLRRFSRLVTVLAIAAGSLVAALPQLLWSGAVIHVSGWALLCVGLALLMYAWWPTATRRILHDQIVDPRTGTSPFTFPRWLPAAIRWGLPAVVLCAVLLILIVPGPLHG